MKNSLIFFVFCICTSNVFAQNNAINNRQLLLQNIQIGSDIFFGIDTTKSKLEKKIVSPKKTVHHNPKLAVILSTVIPGAGQVYNKKYWKTPIIWAGIGACGYFIRSNHILYKDYKSALIQRADTSIKEPDKYLDIYSTDQLLTLQDQYRQNRDIFIIVTSLVYVLNIVDALVDAHLFTFDVSDDLSINWQPFYQYGVNTSSNAGISLQMKFR